MRWTTLAVGSKLRAILQKAVGSVQNSGMNEKIPQPAMQMNVILMMGLLSG
jgi:hypothetical protein